MAMKTKIMTMNNLSFLQLGMTIKVCLFVSFLFHIMAIFAFGDVSILRWAEEKPRSYKVDLIRASVEDLDLEDTPGADLSDAKEDPEPPSTPDQDTISLDTKDERYVSYFQLIKGKIGSQWGYPSSARDMLIEGELMVMFSLVRGGEVIEVALLDPSGYDVLDDEAVRAIRAAAPFPPFPEHITVKRLNIQARFEYRLTSRK